jgi:hypothetical protein
VSIKNNALSTSFRSDTQATDSTWSGCTAKKAATRALAHSAPVIEDITMKSRIVPARWIRTFVP